jgi:L-seryl-tRNA(Ser) seleniumtransferase
LRHIPAVEALLQDAEVARAAAGVPRAILTLCVRQAVGQVRARLEAAPHDPDPPAIKSEIVALVRRQLRAAAGPHFRKVINATGIILHTALGRAVLPRRAVEQIQRHLAGYSLLQADPETGQRSRRDQRIEWLVQELTGAEAATVVNNNAAATAIVLNTVARGREVIVSRGQLVEIGGSFRLPDVMAAAGARLVEVGTTNKTHARDYERAVTDQTAAILRVHPSNYRVVGFTAEVPLEQLAVIARARRLALIDDVGAGPLVDLSQFGLEKEPLLRESLRAGADLVTASTDKLIGGPQGGLILGRADLVQAVRANPMARIVRVGKMTLAALEATLSLFLDEPTALAEVPTLRMLLKRPGQLAEQAERMAAAVRARAPRAEVAVIDGFSQMGSGSLPGQDLPTRLVALRPAELGCGDLALALRSYDPPIFARVHQDRVLLDPRTLLEGEEEVVVGALGEILTGEG